jgi:hypothetical protein
VPAACVFEGSQWLPAWQQAVAKFGHTYMVQLLLLGGIFYHLYNQVRCCKQVEGFSYRCIGGQHPE